ncbi:hypothetical protein JCM11641_002117 [Rhodosporidiobolus odoratus]
MDDTRVTERSDSIPSIQQEDSDRFSKLPPEILQSIFTLCDPPSPPLSKRLLPYTRSASLTSVILPSFRSLELFTRSLRETPAVGAYTRSLTIALLDGTEQILAKENPSLREILLEAFGLLPNVREVQATDWMTTAFILSEDAATGSVLKSMRSLRLAALLAQLNSLDFITYRLALLSRYLGLRDLELMVLPFDAGSANATAFDLFPATFSSDAAPPPPLDMQPVSHLESLTVGGPLCDQRVVNVLRAFANLTSVTLFDSFASAHLTPALSSIDPSSVRTLRLQRLIATPPPVSLPHSSPSTSPSSTFSRYQALEDLVLGIPVEEDLPPVLACLPCIRRIAFTATSSPTSTLIHQLLTSSRPPSLEAIILSHITGQVGNPITSSTLPSINEWLDALRLASADPTAEPTSPPIFPLKEWHLPHWTSTFTHQDAETLFSFSQQIGLHLSGTLLSACLTTFVLERMVEIWTAKAEEGGVEGMSEEERGALEERGLWDALAVRYRGRLMGMGAGLEGQVLREDEGMDMA